jgi:hypothetical protein
MLASLKLISVTCSMETQEEKAALCEASSAIIKQGHMVPNFVQRST